MSIIAKTGSLIGLSALRNLVSDTMAIDMGSASTIIAVRGRGVVVDEPSVVAVNKITGEIIAVGMCDGDGHVRTIAGSGRAPTG